MLQYIILSCLFQIFLLTFIYKFPLFIVKSRKMSEPLFKSDNSSQDDDENTSKHDGFDVFGSIFGKMNIWIAILLFIVFIIINLTVFVDEILKKINSDFVAADGNPTSSGIIIQGVFLSVAYIIIDLLVSGGVV